MITTVFEPLDPVLGGEAQVMTALAALEQALHEQDWGAANEQTRLLFQEGMPSLEAVRRIDVLWQDHSAGRFGFSPQFQIWLELGGPALKPGHEVWELFKKFGNEVGWRRRGHWVGLPGLSWGDDFSTLDIGRQAVFTPKGCLPFHNIMVGYGDSFSPRDCWGEGVWDRWAQVFALIAEQRWHR